MNEGFEWGGGADLSALEGVMWRADNDPRTRATGSMFERLDQVPDWPGFLAAHERGTRMVPRLRERIVDPPLPLVQPAWSLDPHFDLEHHVYRVQVLSPGTERHLAEMVEAVFRRPLDRRRPQWEAVLLTGLHGGRAAYMLRTHHVLGDGLALVQLMDMLHSQGALPGRGEVSQFPGRPTVTPSSLLASRLAWQAKGVPRGAVKQTIDVNAGALHTMLRPWRSTKDLVDYLLSLQRKLSTVGPRSPLLRGRGGIGCRVAFAEFPHAQMRGAGKVAGGSVNDVYIAGMIGALRLFHEHHGVRVQEIPVSIPISLRKASDTLGGNRFTGATFMAPLGEHDPVRRIQLVRERVRRCRDEPALAFIEQMAPIMTRLPTPAIVEIVAHSTSAADVQLTNIPGVGYTAYLAGARVTHISPIGPRPAVAMMAGMMTYQGKACIAMNLDRDVFPDVDLLADCVQRGFAEVLSLAPAAAPDNGVDVSARRRSRRASPPP